MKCLILAAGYGYGAVRIADIIENVCAGKGDILDDK